LQASSYYITVASVGYIEVCRLRKHLVRQASWSCR